MRLASPGQIPEGIRPCRAVQIALRDAGLVPEDIDYINAYGLATPACDWAEARVIKAAFGARAAQIPVSAIQSMTGYPWAAIGAFQLIGNCLAITEGLIAPTINFAVRDSNCDLDVVPNQARHGRINTALSNVFGCGEECGSDRPTSHPIKNHILMEAWRARPLSAKPHPLHAFKPPERHYFSWPRRLRLPAWSGSSRQPALCPVEL